MEDFYKIARQNRWVTLPWSCSLRIFTILFIIM